MVPHTRRRFLHVAAATTAGLAGCGRLTGGSAESTGSATAGGESNPPDGNTATDPPTVLVRAATEVPPLRLADPDREGTETPYPERFSPRVRHDLIDTPSRADRLTAADGATSNGDSTSPSAFLDETDFESETVLLETVRVEECFRLKLCRVSWETDSISTDYTQQLRPYDAHCEDGAHVFESRLVRLPVTLDERSVSGHSTGIGGSGRCGPGRAARAEGSAGEGRSESNANGRTNADSEANSGGNSTAAAGQSISGGVQ